MEASLILVRVFVSDWPRAIRFYTETVGLPLSYRSDELGWAQLATGACQLALERVGEDTRGRASTAAKPDEPLLGRFLGISLAVRDIYATHEELSERGVEFLAPPELMPWGGVLAHFRDPDGNVLTLVGEPRDAEN